MCAPPLVYLEAEGEGLFYQGLFRDYVLSFCFNVIFNEPLFPMMILGNLFIKLQESLLSAASQTLNNVSDKQPIYHYLYPIQINISYSYHSYFRHLNRLSPCCYCSFSVIMDLIVHMPKR